MDMLMSRQHECRHLQDRSRYQVLFCIGNSHDGRGPSRMVLRKAFSCTKKADSETFFGIFPSPQIQPFESRDVTGADPLLLPRKGLTAQILIYYWEPGMLTSKSSPTREEFMKTCSSSLRPHIPVYGLELAQMISSCPKIH